jgi:alpha-L-fucosidase
MEWFRDARFGMFITWGLYSLLGRGEWAMHWDRIPAAEYEQLAGRFNPVRFNPREWVSLAADAGQRYIVITSRHHDGFSMYDTALSDYKVTNTPFRRDPLEELANAAARRSDVKLGFYVSLLDWWHPAYRNRGESGLAWGDYVGFLHGQVRELCSNYGRICCIWLDGDWPGHDLVRDNPHFAPGGSFEYEALYRSIHVMQPDAYVLNNRHVEPLRGEDVQGFEQDLPGENTTGWNPTTVYDLALEVCMTINDNWGFHADDDNHKSTRTLLRHLLTAAAQDSNYLLDVNVNGLGEVVPVHVERLREIGAWLRANGEGFYGTRKGCINSPSGVSTQRGDIHYLYALGYETDRVYLDALPASVTRASLLVDGAPLQIRNENERLFVTVAAPLRDPFATVVKFE